jgi:hypothetical protein
VHAAQQKIDKNNLIAGPAAFIDRSMIRDLPEDYGGRPAEAVCDRLGAQQPHARRAG